MSINSIINGLSINESLDSSSNKIDLKELDKFYSKEKPDTKVKSSITNILKKINLVCNGYGENEWVVKTRYKYDKGFAADPGDGDSGLIGLDINPSRAYVSFIIKFIDKNIKKEASNAIYRELNSMKKLYDNLVNDKNGFSIYFDGVDDYTWFGIVLEVTSNGIQIDVESCKNPLNEGALGTEIGLPIDKENCEGTDISGVATPNGVVGEKRKLKEIICPECSSKDVNMGEGEKFHCASCNHEWDLDEALESQGKKYKKSKKPNKKKVPTNESTYKPGQRYMTVDRMYFTVKKINKDGTIYIYDEDLDKVYNVELSDLELLHPTLVKESISESKGKIRDRDGNEVEEIELKRGEWCNFIGPGGNEYQVTNANHKLVVTKKLSVERVKPIKAILNSGIKIV